MEHDIRVAGSDTAPPPRIEARGIARSFGPVRANRNVSLAAHRGQVLAVIGENGAGKSTLMKMLYGLDRPDEGTILIDGEPVRLSSARDAIRRGIGLVQQELAIVPDLTLLENLVLGSEPMSAGRIDWARARREAEVLAESVGTDINWDLQAAHAPIAIQQQVEILRLIGRGADLLILDEPTAVLAPVQAAQLLDLLRRLVADGKTVIFISHKLGEVLRVADEITVLRAGITEPAIPRADATIEGLATLIMGGEAAPSDAGTPGVPREVVLACSGLTATDDRGIERLSGVDLEVRAGEILGVAAVSGNGQDELAEALIGLRRLAAGSISLRGTNVTRTSVRARRKAGFGYVSADRKHEGLALELSIAENAIASPSLTALTRGGWFSPTRVKAAISSVLTTGAVRYGSEKDPISSLSGGNQQRVVIARELRDRPEVLVASQPTRGVDIRGIAFIHEQLRQARDAGSAVVLFSEELDEIQALADRILVLHQGRVVGELGRDADRVVLGKLMLGMAGEDGARSGGQHEDGETA
ncbi:Galactose/methyl galactoside import ATP-binding protein MglA [Leucobacter aridicollis]|uniref:ABC transporter ATP-binding protein n=1 Tax=Leucobacter aridicollis TaxID=283878 RepID=UPI000EAE0E3F|nr:ABC transporter ATP-binding protein [Leucobacter aridicollis]MCS3427974.1 simple sugar transport system ATP-binding protein [Leucobacter aridicollis]RKQ94761.1 simple sugar transport system ATP-binding protein [Mycolicibacterium mucogenicum 261Sha1.1M5]